MNGGDRNTEPSRALAALGEAFARAESSISDDADPASALECAIQLRRMAGRHAKRANALRDAMARRLWAAERLSLRVLAARVGVGKSRAQQIITNQGDENDYGERPGQG